MKRAGSSNSKVTSPVSRASSPPPTLPPPMTENSAQDTDSIYQQPLLPKIGEAPKPKDYEAAAASLMVAYGFGGHTPTQTPKGVGSKRRTKSTSWLKRRKLLYSIYANSPHALNYSAVLLV